MHHVTASQTAGHRRPLVTALALACLGVAGGPTTAWGVVILVADGTGNTTAPPDDPGWATVGVRGIGNGVYLGAGWVLTAAHVGAGEIVLAGTSYAAAPGSAVQLTNAGAAGRSATTDLVLYRLTTMPPGLAPVTIAATSPAAGAPVTMIGSGLDRGAFTEWTVNQSATPWAWTEVSSGGTFAGYKTASTRQMRWGTNAISANDLWVAASDLDPPLDVKSVGTLFDAQFGTSESQAVNHDSGGAVFAKVGGTWELAGMIFDVGGYSGQPSPAFTPVIGNATYAADLAYYRPQIMAIVPEPPPPLLAIAAAVAIATVARSMRGFRSRARWAAWLVAALPVATDGVSAAAAAIDFPRDVAPVLVRRCLECHSGERPEAGLSLADDASLRRGGDSGAALEPGDSAASLLWQRVAADEMPPKHPLSAEEKRTLAAWVDAGARWQGGPLDLFSNTTETRAGRDFWSLIAVEDRPPPAAELDTTTANWGRGPIDAFVFAGLDRAGLRPATAADPRTLVRRVSFDLVGLPPSPELVEAFAADPSDAAYERLVDSLLASPAYGERWGRHWLDVVRFGESDGFERNFTRDNAWPYRDWVIDALNTDLPYDRFVRMQLVGDVETGGMDDAAATGFWVAGAHNTVVGGSERMKRLARGDEIEEVIGTLGQTFVGLTLQCARCHDHKFDPISQAEYYRLASAISGLGHGERTVSLPDARRHLAALDDELASLRAALAAIDAKGWKRVAATNGGPPPPAALSRWEFEGDLRDSLSGLHGQAVGEVRFADGGLVLDGASHVATPPLQVPLAAKTLEAWVRLDDSTQRGGGVISVESRDGVLFDALVFGEREPGRWLAGSNNFLRSGSFGGADEAGAAERAVHLALVYAADGTITAYREGVSYGRPIRIAPLQPFAAGETEILFGLRHKPTGGNRCFKGRIERAALYDRALTAAEVAASAAAGGVVTEQAVVAALSEADRAERARLTAARDRAVAARSTEAARADRKLYTLAAGRGEVTKILGRGDPDLAGKTVTPGATAAIPGLAADFGLPADAPEADRRRRLADWILHPDNPLFARVIVNRVWHHHFGTGLVDTPSDFGFNGGRPSHPDLLDHLAADFRRHGQSLKRLHRQIVNSTTYRQSSRPADADPRGPEIDAGNRLLWRGPRRRLEAESLRDAMLVVSGALDPSRGGPGYRDVAVAYVAGTTYYTPLPPTPAFFRRSVYRFSPRGDRPPLLDAFDCPDPSVTTPKRSVTTTPLQALALLNDELVLVLADAFATRLRGEARDNVVAQVARGWRLALGREPDAEELRLAESLAAEHGLEAVCRGLFNLAEFVVID